MRIERRQVDDGLDVALERSVLSLGGPQGRDLRGIRQLAVPEQVRDGLDRLRRRELLHGVAAVKQRVRLGVHLADGRHVGDDAGEALVDVGHAHSFVAGFVIWKVKTLWSKWLYAS